MRELSFTHTICLLIVSENRCLNTAECIQIKTMNKYKIDFYNNNLKSLYNDTYLIRLLSKIL